MALRDVPMTFPGLFPWPDACAAPLHSTPDPVSLALVERMPRTIPSALLVVLSLVHAGEPARAAAIHGDMSSSKANRSVQRPGDAVVWIENVPEKVEKKLVKGGRRWFWQKAREPQPPANLLEVA